MHACLISGHQTIINFLNASIRDLDVDCFSDNLFWSDDLRRKIMISKTDGSQAASLISRSLKKPYNIVVDYIKGQVIKFKVHN